MVAKGLKPAAGGLKTPAHNEVSPIILLVIRVMPTLDLSLYDAAIAAIGVTPFLLVLFF